MLSYRVSDAAKSDIESIIEYSFGTFGVEAAVRYENLLKTSINALRSDPERPGVSPTLRELSKFHTLMCKKEAHIEGKIVSKPRHIIFFRVDGDNILQIVRILHESMDFEQHL